MNKEGYIKIPLLLRPLVGLGIGLIGLACMLIAMLVLAAVAVLMLLMPILMIFTPYIKVDGTGGPGFNFKL